MASSSHGNGPHSKPVKSKDTLKAAANALLAAVAEHVDVDLIDRVILTGTRVGVVYYDGLEMSLAEYRKPRDKIPGHRFKSPAEIDEAINGEWL